MFNFITKEETVIKSVNTENVEGVEVWMVSWNSFYGQYSDSPHLVGVKRVAKAFLNREDANAFADSLRNAAKLLQSERLVLDINIEKQE